MQLIEQEAISFDDVTIHTQFSDLKSRSDVDVSAPNHAAPFIASPMWHLGTKAMLEFFAKNGNIFVLHRYFKTAEDQHNTFLEYTSSAEFTGSMLNNIFVAVGSDEQWIAYLINRGIKSFCVDMANGNSIQCINAVKYIKDNCPSATIMAGNVESHDGYLRLKEAGATYIRVGIASGSICSTNINTGNGLPILTALDNIYNGMTLWEKEHYFLIADGGIRTAGDVAKALAFGASYVMCGKMFAATSMAAGPFYTEHMLLVDEEELPNFKGSKPAFVQYAGMASTLMREKAGGSQKTAVSEEGKAGLIKYTGKTEDVFNGMLLNLKAVIAYSGCRTIEEFRENVIMQKIAMGGKREKLVHLDITY